MVRLILLPTKFISGTYQTMASLLPLLMEAESRSSFSMSAVESHLYARSHSMQWHPSKSCIASTTAMGNIHIWHCPHPERWGAFAGGFEEVDENVEYEEKEDEFDIVSNIKYCLSLS